MLLAHSANEKDNIPVQSYRDHVLGVLSRIQIRLSQLRPYLPDDLFRLIEAVLLKAGGRHDMGKVDSYTQQVLEGKARLSFGSKPINHTDAGTAYFLQSGRTVDKMAAWAINAHHRGYADYGSNWRDNTELSCPKYQWTNLTGTVENRTDQLLPEYDLLHSSVVSIEDRDVDCHIDQIPAGLNRLILSVLVDADWGDTAANYRNFVPEKGVDLRSSERLAALVSHVSHLQATSPASDRNRLRQRIFDHCRSFPLQPFTECSALVGLGKTYATIAYALAHNPRKVIYCAPFTTLLSQTEDDFRQCLTLPGEDAWEVVAAHHHQNEYAEGSSEQKALTTAWMPPIILTTHVQLFETCFSNHPSKLRKFFNFAGSHILMDECHLFPEHLWPLAIEALRFLVECLGCRVTFISGSMIKPWACAEIVTHLFSPPPTVHAMIPADIWQESVKQEKTRVRTIVMEGVLNLQGICKTILRSDRKGPKVAIFNTTMNAAVVAYELRHLGANVLHLSTVLAPVDREGTVQQVVELCKAKAEFILVATSCVEAGMNFSFKFGFRERAGLLSDHQLNGRLNRSNEFSVGTLLVFELLTNLMNPRSPFTVNHDYDEPARIHRLLHRHGRTSCEDSDLYFRKLVEKGLRACTIDEEELSVAGLMNRERLKALKTVRTFARVINEAKQTVLINESVLEDRYSDSDAVRNSVEMYEEKATAWEEAGLIEQRNGVKIWRGKYDGFLGYLAEFLD